MERALLLGFTRSPCSRGSLAGLLQGMRPQHPKIKESEQCRSYPYSYLSEKNQENNPTRCWEISVHIEENMAGINYRARQILLGITIWERKRKMMSLDIKR